MSGITNTQIDSILGKYSHYGGCMSKDLLKNKDASDNKYYVINMESSRQGDRTGTHWVVMSVLKDMCFYFDSFGCYIVPKVVKQFSKKSGKKLYTSDVKFQVDKSSACGWWCVWVCLLLEQGKSPKEIVERILPKYVKNAIDLDPSN